MVLKDYFFVGQQLFLPKEVCIQPSTVPGSGLGVFSSTVIKIGTEMGPYPGHVVSTLDDMKSAHAWEVSRYLVLFVLRMLTEDDK